MGAGRAAVRALLAGVMGLALAGCSLLPAQRSQPIVTQDRFVVHTSTVALNAGQKVGLFLRQKALASVAAGQGDMRGKVVLFVHGATVPGVPDYDFEHGTYNWMAFLAQEGFNVYTLDLSGYGGSPRPGMDDPCNVDPKQQSLLIGRPLKAPCAPHHPFDFNTISDDWAEIDTAVDYLRRANRVDRIHLIGWSAGGPRVGGYVAQHPWKVDRVMLYAPSPTIAGPLPLRAEAGSPTNLQTREDFEKKRWDPDVRCPGQVEPGVRDALWKTIMAWDRVGSTWHGPEGVMRGRNATRFGWTPDLAARVTAPTLVMVGDYDRLAERRTVYEQISSKDKVFVSVACASHFMVWEKQHRALQDASLAWLREGQLQGLTRGELRVNAEGRFVKP